MNKDLHNIDDTFNSAYQRFEENPSADVWEKINADLDKRDAEKYKKRSVGWKRIAIILLFLLSGFVLYESGIIKRGSGGRNYNKAERKNSGNTDSSIQNDNAANTPNSQNKNTSNNYSNPPHDKILIPVKNNKDEFEKDVTQQITITDKGDKKKDTTTKNEPVVTNQNVFITNIAKKNRTIPELQLPVSDKQIKPGKIPFNKLPVTAKNYKLIKPVPDADNSGNTPGYEIAVIKKIRPVPSEETPVAQKLYSLALLKEKAGLNIPDSVLSRSLTINQTKKGKVKFKPYWSVTGFASNDWAQYKLENDVEDNNGQPRHDESSVIAKRERHEPSFSTGIMVTRQFTKNLALKTGLIYSNTAIVINPQEIYAAQKTDGTIAYKYNSSSGYGYIKPGFGLPPAIGDSLQSAEAQHSLQSLSIPLLLSYRIEKKRFSIAPSAGITANIITGAKIQTEVKDALNKETVTINGLNGLNHFYAGFMADVNLQYNLDKRWAINVLPTFKYAISPITKSNVVKTFPYSFSIGAGISYKF